NRISGAMTDSAAERKRRSRRHQAGDHALCDPQRCAQAPGAAASTARSRSRGQRLWEEMHSGLGPGQLVVLEEACRIADRLDRLDAQLDDQDWLTFHTRDPGPCQPPLDGLGDDVTGQVTQVTVQVDRALSEARQQAMALKQLVAELRQSSSAAKRTSSTAGTTQKAGGIADLSARIAARRD
ncbi:MAG: hypothetical protein ACRDRZ_03695, partial [Pseudonocardiaceae bacterium]